MADNRINKQILINTSKILFYHILYLMLNNLNHKSYLKYKHLNMNLNGSKDVKKI